MENMTSAWRKSSYSGNNGGECIEVALTSPASALVPVRDSKDPSGPVLLFPAAAWGSFLAAVRDGSLPVGQ
ncbi:protein of unknown function [Streptomyces sp. TLI_053]|uniref:DUF397 domain-containing protein n=1 Tax=Streptomyces sp. TLI_053 TaxID=1855352 RepID=UPI00087C0193|nr:DUF397 domain-containing protein [Streptomyces sp. TLI_053]SDT51485.1 protein of unknown function [Streptomyces sp. TLI_053]